MISQKNQGQFIVSLNKLNTNIVYFTIFVFTKALGLYKDEGGIGLGQLNILGILQILSILFLFWGLLLNRNNIKFAPSSIKKILLILGGIVLLNILLGFYKSIIGDYSLSSYFKNIYSIYIYIFFVFLFSIYKTQEDINSIFKIINRLALFAALVTIYQVIFVKTSVMSGTNEYDKFRYISTTGLLTAFSFFNHYSNLIINKKYTPNHIFLLALTGTSVIIQMHRSILIGFFLALIIPFLSQFKIKKVLITGILISFFGYLAFGIISRITALPSNYFENLIIGSISDLRSGEGSFFTRFLVLVNTFIDVINNYPFLGRGFLWIELDFLAYLTQFKAYTITYDNTYTNVLLCYGILGFITYNILLFTSLKKLSVIEKKERSNNILTLKIITFYYFFTSFFSDYLFGTPNTVVTMMLFISIHLSLLKNETTNYDKSKIS